MVPLCPAVRFVGLASVRLPPRVTEKLLAAAKSGVMVAPSVSAVIVPRWATVNDWTALVTATLLMAPALPLTLKTPVLAIAVPVTLIPLPAVATVMFALPSKLTP